LAIRSGIRCIGELDAYRFVVIGVLLGQSFDLTSAVLRCQYDGIGAALELA